MSEQQRLVGLFETSNERDRAKAFEALAEAIAQQPQDAALRHLAAYQYWLTQAWQNSAEEAMQCLQIVPDHLHAASMLFVGWSLHRIGTKAIADRLLEALNRLPKQTFFPDLLAVAEAVLTLPTSTLEQRFLSLLSTQVEKHHHTALRQSRSWCVLGALRLRHGDTKGAIDAYKEASTELPATIGLCRCDLARGEAQSENCVRALTLSVKDVAKPLDAIALALLQLDLIATRKGDSAAIWPLLSTLLEIWTAKLKQLSSELRRHRQPGHLTPILQAVDLYALEASLSVLLQYLGPLSFPNSGLAPVALRTLEQMAETYLVWMTSSPKPFLYRAKTHLLFSKSADALRVLNSCLEQFPSCAEAYVLRARCHLFAQEASPDTALKELDTAVGASFAVRETAEFAVWRAHALRHQRQFAEAVQQCHALSTTHKHLPGLTRAFLALEEAICQRALKGALSEEDHLKEKESLLSGFRGETEARAYLLYLYSEVELDAHRIDEAIATLQSIESDHLLYASARARLAEVVIKHRRDYTTALAIYTQLHEQSPNEQTALLLGDLYLHMQEPLKAVKTFDTALKAFPQKASLFGARIGTALLGTHHYSAALKYFKGAAEKNPGVVDSHAVQRCRLLFALEKYEQCEEALQSYLPTVQAHFDRESFSAQSIHGLELYLLQGAMLKQQGGPSAASPWLKAILPLFDRYIRATDSGVSVEDQQRAQTLAAIAYEYLGEDGDDANRLQMMEESLKRDASRRTAAFRATQLYIAKGGDPNLSIEVSTGWLAKARQLLQTLLEEDPSDSEALLLLADFHLLRHGLPEAKRILVGQLAVPSAKQWDILSRFLVLCRRQGTIASEGKTQLQSALAPFGRATQDDLFHSDAYNQKTLPEGARYAIALYNAFTRRTAAAVLDFNRLRSSSTYCARALKQMVLLYLQPVLSEGLAIFERPLTEQEEAQLSTAYELLRDQKGEHVELLRVLITLHRQQGKQETVFSKLQERLEKQDSTSPVLLLHVYIKLLATSHDKTHRTKLVGAIHRFQALTWSPAHLDWFSYTRLFIAQHHFEHKHIDEAVKELRLSLKYDESFVPALEFLGKCMQRKGEWSMAIEEYRKAWALSNCTDAELGYHLATSQLKVKHFRDALNTCHRLLALYPNYQNVQDKLLPQAQKGLLHL